MKAIVFQSYDRQKRTDSSRLRHGVVTVRKRSENCSRSNLPVDRCRSFLVKLSCIGGVGVEMREGSLSEAPMRSLIELLYSSTRPFPSVRRRGL